MPDPNLTFRGQRDGETVILLIRRHPWTMAKQAAITTLGLALIILMFVWFQASQPAIWTFFVVGLGILLYGLIAWYSWWNTMYLLTNQRIIAITQKNLFSRRIEDYSLDKIQSVASDNEGLAPTLLGFGNVMLAIMGIRDQVRLPYVEDPYAVQERILSTMKQHEGHLPLNHYANQISKTKRRRV